MTRQRRSFDPLPSAAGAARQFVRSLLGRDARAEDASLVVSELATNAVCHARSPFTVTVTVGGSIRIEVSDASAELPSPRRATPDTADGRGLQIVERIASSWGTQRNSDGGKVVWADLDARRTPVSPSPWPEGRVVRADR